MSFIVVDASVRGAGVSPLPSFHAYDSHLTIDYLALDH